MEVTSSMLIAFWGHVRKGEVCWAWEGPLTDKGYGRFYHNYRAFRAHRVAYLALVGPIPDGVEVCHDCDNRACVNPEHLFLGTHGDNMADMSGKDRGARLRGEANGHAKLTQQQVISIRSRYAAGGISQRQLAKEYGVSQGAVWHIVNGRQWRQAITPGPNPPATTAQASPSLPL